MLKLIAKFEELIISFQKYTKWLNIFFLNIKIISIWEILDLIINWCSFQNFKDTWNYT